MNLHFKTVIERIRKKHPQLDFNYLYRDSFVNKYFPNDEFGYLILSEKLQKEFDRRLIVALEDAISVYKNKRTLWFVLTPFTYFFGSILRDFIVYDLYFYEGGSGYNFTWIMWVLFGIVFPIMFGAFNYYNSKALREFINLELLSVSSKDTGTINEDLNYKEINYKKNLRELNNLFAEDLITQEEYDEKRKQILDNLTRMKKDD